MAKLSGFRELDRKLAELSLQAQGKVLRASMRSAMTVAKKAATARAPVGKKLHKTYKGRLVAPGFAKRSLKVGVGKTGLRAVMGVKAEAFYALQFVELGTKRMPKRPWFVPAFHDSQDKIIDMLGKQIAKRIEKIAKAAK